MGKKDSSEILKQTEGELKKANQKILEQQTAVIEEERLKVLLRTAGATAHELNQPLTALLGNIDLLKMDKDQPEKLVQHLATIEEAGRRIANIARRIQDIRPSETTPYSRGTFSPGLDQQLNILSIEDSDKDFQKIRALFNGRGRKKTNLFRARGVREASDLLARARFDLIFLDHLLPDGNGLDFLKTMNKRGCEIPVVVITGNGDEMVASQVIQNGAYDYLPKDMLTKESLARSISNALEKSELKKSIKKAQKRMAEMSIRDALTGLYNRRYFMEALERELARAGRYDSDVVLCMIDLDFFKGVNDTYGHLAGDMVLSTISKMLKECIRESDLLCRYGGEEFTIILTNTGPEKALTVCERFRKMVARHEFEYNAFRFRVTVSMGMAFYDSAADHSPMELVDLADRALYNAKNTGRNKVVEYSNKIGWLRPKIGHVFVSEGYITEGELKKALSEQKLKQGKRAFDQSRVAEGTGHATL